jgi:Asp-tRNA(Asn)/Glu-tRNA(Gln) amidotransferase A subunit family amidase
MPVKTAIKNLNELGALEAARLIAAREISSCELVEACLDRIAEREPAVNAFAAIDRTFALDQAELCDSTPAQGPLHGVPFAVKDVLNTFDLPTSMGSPIYPAVPARDDAACVAALRAAGCVVLGKTVTAEFAGTIPGPTTNPHNMSHTPGGSSSGSAAAVADHMVPLALGTQTGGSIIRPSSFCGVVGYKPSFGLVNRAGLKIACDSLDTIGFIARNMADILPLAAITAGIKVPAETVRPPTIAVCHGEYWHELAPEARAAVTQTAEKLSEMGCIIREMQLPAEFIGLRKIWTIINNYERARALTHEWRENANMLSPQLHETIESGLEISHHQYIAAIRLAEKRRIEFEDFFDNCDTILTPSAGNEAPEGLESTGDSKFQSQWTLLHVPAVSLPVHFGANGLPIGVQFLGRRHADSGFLAIANWIFSALELAEFAGSHEKLSETEE